MQNSFQFSEKTAVLTKSKSIKDYLEREITRSISITEGIVFQKSIIENTKLQIAFCVAN